MGIISHVLKSSLDPAAVRKGRRGGRESEVCPRKRISSEITQAAGGKLYGSWKGVTVVAVQARPEGKLGQEEA